MKVTLIIDQEENGETDTYKFANVSRLCMNGLFKEVKDKYGVVDMRGTGRVSVGFEGLDITQWRNV